MKHALNFFTAEIAVDGLGGQIDQAKLGIEPVLDLGSERAAFPDDR